MSHLDIRMLGPIQVSVDDTQRTDAAYAKVRVLLLFLAAAPERAHPRDELAELLWPDQPTQTGRNSLRQALAKLRQFICGNQADPPFLLISRDAVQINPAGVVAVDAAAFRALLAACARHQHSSLLACGECAARWEAAVMLYRGPFADGPLPTDSQPLEEWLLVQREWFSQQTLDGLAYLAAYHEQRGHNDLALGHARRQIALDPWREAAHRQVMRMLAADGQRAAALAQYHACRKVLHDELGVEPEPETTALYEQIQVVSSTPQLAPDDLPPAHYPLPAQTTSFVGRKTEQATLIEWLRTPHRRLITLLGPGGIGKTRLALTIAEQAAPLFRQGVCWVQLAATNSADQVLDALAGVLGLTGEIDRQNRLLGALQPRAALLVFDNMEHVLDAATLLADILRHAPNVRILTTSRERLHLQSEWVYDVQGLGLPPDSDLAGNSESVRLFQERATQAQGHPPLT